MTKTSRQIGLAGFLRAVLSMDMYSMFAIHVHKKNNNK